MQSVEEIRSHTIDEDMDPLNKAFVLLKSAYEAQLICGIRMLPELLSTQPDDTIERVFPDFKEVCFVEDLNRSEEFYQALNTVLLQILSQKLLSNKEFSLNFVELITQKIYLYCDKPTDYENFAIYQLWVDLMVEVISQLNENCVKSAVFDQIPRMKLQFASRRTREYVSMILAKCAPRLSHQV